MIEHLENLQVFMPAEALQFAIISYALESFLRLVIQLKPIKTCTIIIIMIFQLVIKIITGMMINISKVGSAYR